MDVLDINRIIEFIIAYKWWLLAIVPFVIAAMVLRR